jgi:hypothetical protein
MSFSMKFDGLGDLAKHLEGLADFGKSMDGLKSSPEFDPNDEASIQAAIREAHAEIDHRLGPNRSNATARAIAQELKEGIEARIRSMASAKRNP